MRGKFLKLSGRTGDARKTHARRTRASSDVPLTSSGRESVILLRTRGAGIVEGASKENGRFGSKKSEGNPRPWLPNFPAKRSNLVVPRFDLFAPRPSSGCHRFAGRLL